MLSASALLSGSALGAAAAALPALGRACHQALRHASSAMPATEETYASTQQQKVSLHSTRGPAKACARVAWADGRGRRCGLLWHGLGRTRLACVVVAVCLM